MYGQYFPRDHCVRLAYTIILGDRFTGKQLNPMEAGSRWWRRNVSIRKLILIGVSILVISSMRKTLGCGATTSLPWEALDPLCEGKNISCLQKVSAHAKKKKKGTVGTDILISYM